MSPRRGLAGALAAVAVLAPAAGAGAAGLDVRLSEHAEWPQRELSLTLPEERPLRATDLSLTENGAPVSGLEVRSGAADPRRGIVLAIDASRSMEGAPIRHAVVAARRLARHRGERTPLGVLFFASTTRTVLEPTSSGREIAHALAVGPALRSGSDITAATTAAVESLRDAGMTSGTVIVLSDGAQTRSRVSAGEAAAAAVREDVRVFTVGLRSERYDGAFLDGLAAATGGTYAEAASAADLPAVFAAIGDRLSSEYLVAWDSQQPAGREVSVRAEVDGLSATARYEAPALDVPRLREADPAGGGLSAPATAAVILLVFGAVALVVYLVVSAPRRSVVARIGDFAGIAEPAGELQPGPPSERRARSPRAERWSDQLELSGLRAPVGAVVAATAAGTGLLAAFMIARTGHAVMGLFAIAVPFGVRLLIGRRVAARRLDYERQLPDNVQMLASALRTGYSFSAALAMVAQDAAEPSRTEFLRASADEQLGVAVTDALGRTAARMNSPETAYVGIVAAMQAQTGGNTAEILDHVVATVRERLRLRRTIRVLTAQSRTGAAMLTAAPVVAGIAMSILHPGYFDPMLEKTLGVVLLLGGALMIASGWLIMRRIVRLEA